MKLASMWRWTRRNRAKRAPAVSLPRRGSASLPLGGRDVATAPILGNRRGMRDAHLAQPCRVGLKLRFARRPMSAQGLRPPRRIGKAAPQHGKTGKGKSGSFEV